MWDKEPTGNTTLKKVNFGTLYFQSAEALSEQLFVPLHYTQEWLAAHKILYNIFHAWAKEQKGLGEARGWSKLEWSGRIKYLVP